MTSIYKQGGIKEGLMTGLLIDPPSSLTSHMFKHQIVVLINFCMRMYYMNMLIMYTVVLNFINKSADQIHILLKLS